MCTDAHRAALMRHLSSTASPVPTPVTATALVPDQRVATEASREDSNPLAARPTMTSAHI
jgi:hypothetical protein